MKTKKLALAIGVMVMAGGALAQSTSMEISASVAPTCAVSQNKALDFGSLDMLTGAAQSSIANHANGKVDAICTKGSPSPTFTYTSTNTSGENFRLIGTNGEFITYTLHQDENATLSAVVAHGTAVAHPEFSADGEVQQLNLSAEILPIHKNGTSVQSYGDTITINANFGA